jgi:hypothetical protein
LVCALLRAASSSIEGAIGVAIDRKIGDAAGFSIRFRGEIDQMVLRHDFRPAHDDGLRSTSRRGWIAKELVSELLDEVVDFR